MQLSFAFFTAHFYSYFGCETSSPHVAVRAFRVAGVPRGPLEEGAGWLGSSAAPEGRAAERGAGRPAWGEKRQDGLASTCVGFVFLNVCFKYQEHTSVLG